LPVLAGGHHFVDMEFFFKKGELVGDIALVAVLGRVGGIGVCGMGRRLKGQTEDQKKEGERNKSCPATPHNHHLPAQDWEEATLNQT
jgi:hypothetical protein